MNDKQLKAYIRDKFGYKVKNIRYGYILLVQESYGADSWWRLQTNKVYNSVSEIVDDLCRNKNITGE